jgi:hypothetical protein
MFGDKERFLNFSDIVRNTICSSCAIPQFLCRLIPTKFDIGILIKEYKIIFSNCMRENCELINTLTRLTKTVIESLNGKLIR